MPTPGAEPLLVQRPVGVLTGSRSSHRRGGELVEFEQGAKLGQAGAVLVVPWGGAGDPPQIAHAGHQDGGQAGQQRKRCNAAREFALA